MTVPAGKVVKITESIPVEQAATIAPATIAPATVALHGLRLVKVEAGRSVAVRGHGITGRYVLQRAKLLGASTGRGESRRGGRRGHTKDCPEGELSAGLDTAGLRAGMSGEEQTMWRCRPWRKRAVPHRNVKIP